MPCCPRLASITLEAPSTALEPRHSTGESHQRARGPRPLQLMSLKLRNIVSSSRKVRPAQGTFQTYQDLSKRMPLPIAKNLQNLPLPIAQVMTDSARRQVLARQEPHHHFCGSFLELRLWMPCGLTQFDDLLRAS